MKMLIAGEWVDRANKIEVRNPYDDSLIDTVPRATPEDLDAAIESAQRGFAAVRELPAHERSEVLFRASERLKADLDDLARLVATEVGKTVREARGEITRASATFRIASEEAKRIHGETVPFDAAPGAENKMGFYIREPVGLVAAITPFNFPVNLAAHKLAPAYAAGCSVILKPASVTPLADIRLGEILLDCGLPPEALNILTGPGDVVGDALVADERIRKVTFTGSAEVGKHIMKSAGLKKCTMELGSDSAVVLMDDADLRAACERIKVGGYAVAGQVCISTQRVLVQDDIYDEFLQTMLPIVEGLRAGDQLDESTDVGPMVTEQAAALTEQRIAEAVARGAKVLCGGRRSGAVMTPAILTDVPHDAFLGCGEAFAPLIIVRRFAAFDDAIEQVNESSYGLQAGIYTSDIGNAFAFIKGAHVGGVMVNELPTFRVDHMPYGGVKDSGLGREGLRYAIEEMTEIKIVAFNL